MENNSCFNPLVASEDEDEDEDAVGRRLKDENVCWQLY